MPIRKSRVNLAMTLLPEGMNSLREQRVNGKEASTKTEHPNKLKKTITWASSYIEVSRFIYRWENQVVTKSQDMTQVHKGELKKRFRSLSNKFLLENKKRIYCNIVTATHRISTANKVWSIKRTWELFLSFLCFSLQLPFSSHSFPLQQASFSLLSP